MNSPAVLLTTTRCVAVSASMSSIVTPPTAVESLASTTRPMTVWEKAGAAKNTIASGIARTHARGLLNTADGELREIELLHILAIPSCRGRVDS
jgi:hypothetical protein